MCLLYLVTKIAGISHCPLAILVVRYLTKKKKIGGANQLSVCIMILIFALLAPMQIGSLKEIVKTLAAYQINIFQ